MPPEIRNSRTEMPTRITPSQAFGEKTNAPPKRTIDATMLPTRRMACVRYIAIGSSDQAMPRSPLRTPFLRQTRRLRRIPTIVTIRHVVPVAMLNQVLMDRLPPAPPDPARAGPARPLRAYDLAIPRQPRNLTPRAAGHTLRVAAEGSARPASTRRRGRAPPGSARRWARRRRGTRPPRPRLPR